MTKRLWVLALRSQTPILDDDEFLQKLGAGRELLSDVGNGHVLLVKSDTSSVGIVG